MPIRRRCFRLSAAGGGTVQIFPRIKMKNKALDGTRCAQNRGNLPRAFSVMTAAAVLLCTGCTPKTDSNPQTSFATARNVTLTDAQRQNIHLYTVAQSNFRKKIETNGT